MTQEELDALMNGGLDLDALTDEEESQTPPEAVAEDEGFEADESDYKVDSSRVWPPPPPSKEHQVVSQLDDVTKESEEKASAIFDILDGISATAGRSEKTIKTVAATLAEQQEIFAKLAGRFPAMAVFEEQRAKSAQAVERLNEVKGALGGIGDDTMTAMDIMQYQDIHRQKIERVINVMRALSNYMNKLFEGNVDDTKRVSSAKHIAGDSTAEVVDEDDIEALIASFGKK